MNKAGETRRESNPNPYKKGCSWNIMVNKIGKNMRNFRGIKWIYYGDNCRFGIF